MAVLSLNLPSRFGAEEPLATTTEPTNRLPSLGVLPIVPPGLSKVATQVSPKVFGVPAGSAELSAPMNTRPSRSQAMTGSPDEAVRIFASAAYGDVSPG